MITKQKQQMITFEKLEQEEYCLIKQVKQLAIVSIIIIFIFILLLFLY